MPIFHQQTSTGANDALTADGATCLLKLSKSYDINVTRYVDATQK